MEDGLETKDQTSTQYFDAKIIYNKQQTMFILAGRQNQTSRGGLSSDPRKDHVKVHFYYLQLEWPASTHIYKPLRGPRLDTVLRSMVHII